MNGILIYIVHVCVELKVYKLPYNNIIMIMSMVFYVIPGPVTLFQVRPSTIMYGLVITWGPPSRINHHVSYRVRYRKRLSSGSPDNWSSTVVRNATQREYTTPTLKPGTRYEVEVWAVTSIEEGARKRQVATTYQRECILYC